MRADMSAFEARSAKSLKDALKTLSGAGEWKAIAGGTDVMVFFAAGKLSGGRYIDIWGLKELKGIKVSKSEIVIGALTTFTEIREHAVIRKEFPNLIEAARETGAIAIQNRGTIGGNIANASPAADTPPALLAYDAEIELVSLKGTRKMPYSEFHTGYKKMRLEQGELIRAVRIKRGKPGAIHFYRKVGTRKAQAISKICVSAHGRWSKKLGGFEEIRFGIGAVAPTAIRLKKTEELLSGAKFDEALLKSARAMIASEIAPIDDIRSNRGYRNLVTANVIERFLREVAR